MRALCVGRHAFLSEHYARLFRAYGLDTLAAVGVEAAPALARQVDPDLVLCDYDLLGAPALVLLERDEMLSRIPVIAVSMTRKPAEVHLTGTEGIAGFLYLPTLRPEDARRVLGVVRAPRHFALQSALSSAVDVSPTVRT